MGPVTLRTIGAVGFQLGIPIGLGVPLVAAALSQGDRRAGTRDTAGVTMIGTGIAASVGSVLLGVALTRRPVSSLQWVVDSAERISVRLSPKLLATPQNHVVMLLGTQFGAGFAFGGAASLLVPQPSGAGTD